VLGGTRDLYAHLRVPGPSAVHFVFPARKRHVEAVSFKALSSIVVSVQGSLSSLFKIFIPAFALNDAPRTPRKKAGEECPTKYG